MEIFEVKIKEDTFKISRDNPECYKFSVFNHATFHVIQKNDFGIWKDVGHRYGSEHIPIDEIGEAIENHYRLYAIKAAGASRVANS
ncbi:MAG: hypothetical protein JWP45_801 [Mucilaginibacter sp.]|jgi:hypothetical protein|nr:hypothetical protein [Mucilaginibacter sp.]MDB5138868.1 hypothetical protein [Mucilaginibacter sp.]